MQLSQTVIDNHSIFTKELAGAVQPFPAPLASFQSLGIDDLGPVAPYVHLYPVSDIRI